MIDVYCHTNRITGKSYVGQSCYGMMARWKSHVKSAGKCDLLFARAIRKHGPEAFTHEVLEQHESQEDADEAEDFFIEYLMTKAPNGYNLRGGGARGRHSEEAKLKMRDSAKDRPPFSEEHRRNLSEAHKGRKLSEESRRKISEANKRQNLSEERRRNISEANKGRKHSEETKAKISEANKGRKFSEEHRRNISAAAILRAAKKRQ